VQRRVTITPVRKSSKKGINQKTGWLGAKGAGKREGPHAERSREKGHFWAKNDDGKTTKKVNSLKQGLVQSYLFERRTSAGNGCSKRLDHWPNSLGGKLTFKVSCGTCQPGGNPIEVDQKNYLSLQRLRKKKTDKGRFVRGNGGRIGKMREGKKKTHTFFVPNIVGGKKC